MKFFVTVLAILLAGCTATKPIASDRGYECYSVQASQSKIPKNIAAGIDIGVAKDSLSEANSRAMAGVLIASALNAVGETASARTVSDNMKISGPVVKLSQFIDAIAARARVEVTPRQWVHGATRFPGFESGEYAALVLTVEKRYQLVYEVTETRVMAILPLGNMCSYDRTFFEREIMGDILVVVAPVNPSPKADAPDEQPHSVKR